MDHDSDEKNELKMSTARARATTRVPLVRGSRTHAGWPRELSQLGGEVLGALSNTRVFGRGAAQGDSDGASTPNVSSAPSSARAKSGVPAGALANGQASVAQVREPER